MADFSNLKINELFNVEGPQLRDSLKWNIKIEKIKRRNYFMSKGKYENRQNWEGCGISSGRTFLKFINFRNFDNELIYELKKFRIFINSIQFSFKN